MQKFKTAGYIRLSKEDKIKDESNSVTNQKLIITSYIEKNESVNFSTDLFFIKILMIFEIP